MQDRTITIPCWDPARRDGLVMESLLVEVHVNVGRGRRRRRQTPTSHDSPQVLFEGAAILVVVIVDVDLIVDPGRGP
jgi:hypothetical protein